jgi:hypothetical protein
VVATVVQSGSWSMTDEERRQQRREAGLKSAQTKGADRLREIAARGAATRGKEGMRQAALKGLAKRTPEQLSEAARKANETRRRNRAAKKNEGQAPGS